MIPLMMVEFMGLSYFIVSRVVSLPEESLISSSYRHGDSDEEFVLFCLLWRVLPVANRFGLPCLCFCLLLVLSVVWTVRGAV